MAPSIHDLVQRFDRNRAQYTKQQYDEANTRVDFIDRFFDLLGWDMSNSSGYAESYRDVVREDTVVIEGKPKAPDYSFRVGGLRKFFVEAKKPSVNIRDDSAPAFQLRRYAYTAKLSLSILTDFEEFAIYDTRIKPHKNDDASVARIFYCRYNEYEQKFADIANTFSKEAILQGGFDRYAEDNRSKKGTTEVDRDFLSLIETWRNALARNIAIRNKQLTIYELNYAVQKIIDRIIFLRIAEDREIEPYGSLRNARSNRYEELNTLCVDADRKYNSGLFAREEFFDRLIIDDKVLQPIIDGLYYPDCPYEFSVLSTEILGSIYEQFLGKTIRLTASHQAKIEEKQSVRKAGGIYYTPQYIVDYIIAKTVGVALKGKTPEEVGRLRIVDPACGSGGFLLSAYRCLLDWHLRHYCADAKRKHTALKGERIYPRGRDEYALTIVEKQRILLNNIYGVDIDSQAIEVTKLSLLLKLMEGESQESVSSLLHHSDLQALPNLSANIRCGNALIGSDFYRDQNMTLFGEAEMRRINVFDWQSKDDGFGTIMNAGGFDVVIGNPPYGAELDNMQRTYLEEKFQMRNTDTACLFMGLATNISNQNGVNSYIVPKPFVYASNWQTVREKLLDGLVEICDCGKVWQKVKLEQVIYRHTKKRKSRQYHSCVRSGFEMNHIGTIDKKTVAQFGFYLNGISDNELAIAEKMRSAGKFLNDYVINQRGAMYQKHIQQEPSDYKVLGGKQISRYYIDKTPKGYLNARIVTDEKARIKENAVLVQRIVSHVQNPTPHIVIIATPASTIEVSKYILVDTINQLENNSPISSNCIAALLNSRLVSWYAYHFIFGKAIRTIQFDNPTTSHIPMPNLSPENLAHKKAHDTITEVVAEIIKTKQQAQPMQTKQDGALREKRLNILDQQINNAVYKLYGLNKEDIQTIESGGER